MTIMVVEDNPHIRASIREWIAHRLPEITAVVECGDGLEAVEMYRRVKPDWVLMDIKLPSLDGLQATRRIRRLFPDARVIILTNYSDESFREEASQLGARAYVLKENLADLENLLGQTSQL